MPEHRDPIEPLSTLRILLDPPVLPDFVTLTCPDCLDPYDLSDRWPIINCCPACAWRDAIYVAQLINTAIADLDPLWEHTNTLLKGTCPICHQQAPDLGETPSHPSKKKYWPF